MSKPENTLAGKPLPSPRSPAHLDERIIAQARAALPPAKPVYQPWWLAGSATAAVVVVAVTLSVTNYPAFTPAVYEEYGAEAEPTSIQSHAAQAIMQSAPTPEKRMPAKVKASPTSRKMRAEPAIADSFIEAKQVNMRLPAQVLKSLQALAKLDDPSEIGAARMQYEQLKLRCPECVLPETLEEAITEHLAPRH